MRLTDDTKLVLAVIFASLLIIVFGAYFALRPEPTYARSQLFRDDTVYRGSLDASVYLVEFSDFQCPACKAFAPIIEALINKHGTKLLFGYRHFPLPQHAFATDAALAFEAANDQKKAWNMSEYLFANQQNLSIESLNKGVTQLGLEITSFDNAMRSKKYKTKIDNDVADATRLGVNSTPTFFLNGKKLHLSNPNDLLTAVDKAVSEIQ